MDKDNIKPIDTMTRDELIDYLKNDYSIDDETLKILKGKSF